MAIQSRSERSCPGSVSLFVGDRGIRPGTVPDLFSLVGDAGRVVSMASNRIASPVATPSANGQAKGRRKAPKRPTGHPGRHTGRLRWWLTVGMGTGIPALSLSLSSIGGRLLEQGHYALGSGAMGLCCSVLAVSLSHLAWAVKDITGSSRWQAWALAVAVDLSLVLGELSRVAGFDLWVVPVVMVSVTVASAILNTWAFLRGAR